MIETPTVLVLGAGASYDYDFPLGQQLKKKIQGSLSSNTSIRNLLRDVGYDPDYQRTFSRHLSESAHESIDAFLEFRPDYINVGKAAIAAHLLPYEISNTLSSDSPDKSWYQWLYQCLTRGLSFDNFD